MGDSNPAAGLLLLLAGVMLLLMYVTGRLEWLFSIGRSADSARTGAAPASATSAPPLHPALQTSPQGPSA